MKKRPTAHLALTAIKHTKDRSVCTLQPWCTGFARYFWVNAHCYRMDSEDRLAFQNMTPS